MGNTETVKIQVEFGTQRYGFSHKAVLDTGFSREEWNEYDQAERDEIGQQLLDEWIDEIAISNWDEEK